MAWKASCGHRTGENKKDNDEIKKIRSKLRAPVIMSCDSEIDQINKYALLYSKFIVNLSFSLGLLV